MRKLAHQRLPPFIEYTSNLIDNQGPRQMRQIIQLAQYFVDGGKRTQSLMFRDGRHSSFKVQRGGSDRGEG